MKKAKSNGQKHIHKSIIIGVSDGSSHQDYRLTGMIS